MPTSPLVSNNKGEYYESGIDQLGQMYYRGRFTGPLCYPGSYCKCKDSKWVHGKYDHDR